MLPIYSELQNPVYPRIVKVINRAILVDYVFYLTIASAGYFSTFSNTAKIVLERVTIDGKPDYACLIAILGVILSITVAFPCGYNPARAQMSLCASTLDYALPTLCWVMLSKKAWYAP